MTPPPNAQAPRFRFDGTTTTDRPNLVSGTFGSHLSRAPTFNWFTAWQDRPPWVPREQAEDEPATRAHDQHRDPNERVEKRFEFHAQDSYESRWIRNFWDGFDRSFDSGTSPSRRADASFFRSRLRHVAIDSSRGSRCILRLRSDQSVRVASAPCRLSRELRESPGMVLSQDRGGQHAERKPFCIRENAGRSDLRRAARRSHRL